MKQLHSLIIFTFLLITNLSISQNKKTCDSDTENIIDDLSNISKCSIVKYQDSSKENKTELRISYRRVRKIQPHTKSLIKERKKLIKSLGSEKLTKQLNTFSKTKIHTERIKTNSIKQILFSVVDRVPLFSKCSNSEKNNQRKCFNNEFSNHFSNNFNPERATDETIKKRVFVQFIINYQGQIEDIKIKSQKKSALLKKEIKRVILKLPTFIPGLHNGLPVNVKYSIPINLDLE